MVCCRTEHTLNNTNIHLRFEEENAKQGANTVSNAGVQIRNGNGKAKSEPSRLEQRHKRQ